MQRLDILRQRVDELYQAHNSGSDEWTVWGYVNHVLVVARLAEEIATRHKANTELVVAGALLHDIADAVMTRDSREHEETSLKMAASMLKDAGFGKIEAHTITEDIIKPHSCRELMPNTTEGKVLACADGAAHFLTDFYLYFCWQHYGAEEYGAYKQWVLAKIERDYHRKLFFEEVTEQITPKYEALKTLFS